MLHFKATHPAFLFLSHTVVGLRPQTLLRLLEMMSDTQDARGMLPVHPVFSSIKCVSCLCVWHEGEWPPLYCRGW